MRLIFISMILSILLTFPVVFASVDVANVDIVLTNQNPYPAEPGGNVDVEIEIQNKGLTDATNVMIEVFPKEPFSLLPGQEKTKKFTRITAGESVKATYTFSVSDKALSSDYELEFRIYSSPLKENYVKKSVTISVQGEPHLIVENVLTYPQTIEPGGNVKLVITLKNVGSGTARNVEISINSSSPEILPVLSGGRVYVGDIEANETKEAALKMSIGSNAEHRTYLAILLLNYKDESNIQRSEVFVIGIPVTGTINLHIINIEPDFDRETLDIEVANQGTTDAKSVEARLVVNGKTIGVDYISQLKATKKTVFSFPLILQGEAELVLNYTGPGLEKNSIIKYLGRLEYKKPNESAVTTIFYLGVAIVSLYSVWRLLLKKKKRTKSH